jgi:hypothetical protein
MWTRFGIWREEDMPVPGSVQFGKLEFLDIESRSVCSACIWSGIFTTNEDELHKEVSMGTIWGEWESVSQ